mmetsp:Transcript_12325/g.35740  ORF Transcript_12325/g.35740 Transcript_12325/m.35740 type:complete len:127 (-) Transcript_12325:461-841(-)
MLLCSATLSVISDKRTRQGNDDDGADGSMVTTASLLQVPNAQYEPFCVRRKQPLQHDVHPHVYPQTGNQSGSRGGIRLSPFHPSAGCSDKEAEREVASTSLGTIELVFWFNRETSEMPPAVVVMPT